MPDHISARSFLTHVLQQASCRALLLSAVALVRIYRAYIYCAFIPPALYRARFRTTLPAASSYPFQNTLRITPLVAGADIPPFIYRYRILRRPYISPYLYLVSIYTAYHISRACIYRTMIYAIWRFYPLSVLSEGAETCMAYISRTVMRRLLCRYIKDR